MIQTVSLIALTIIAIASAIWLLWWLPKKQVISARRRLKETEPPIAENEFRKTLAQILGGVFVLAGLTITWLQFSESRQQFATNMKLSESGQVTARFSKAVEQLASENLTETLGGIYALERIARDSVNDHWTVIEVLTAFIRERAPISAEEEAGAQDAAVTAEVQAALTVIGRRKRRDEKGKLKPGEYNAYAQDPRKANSETAGNRLPLFKTDLRGANLLRADLSEATLEATDLSGASLFDANLREAELSEANLRGVDLREADLFEAYLLHADLREADLRGSKMCGVNLLGADLMGADMSGADLRRADLRFNSTFTEEQLETAFGDARTQLPEGVAHPRQWELNIGLDPDIPCAPLMSPL